MSSHLRRFRRLGRHEHSGGRWCLSLPGRGSYGSSRCTLVIVGVTNEVDSSTTVETAHFVPRCVLFGVGRITFVSRPGRNGQGLGFAYGVNGSIMGMSANVDFEDSPRLTQFAM